MTTIEYWKPIMGYEHAYEVSNIGRVRGLERDTIKSDGVGMKIGARLMKGSLCHYGYPQVVLSNSGDKKRFKIHRLVALAFIPNPQDKPCINHKNGIKHDNRVENLEWCTYAENILHAIENDMMPSGEQRKASKLTVVQVKEIKNRLRAGEPQRSIADIYNVSQTTIYYINTKKTWRKV